MKQIETLYSEMTGVDERDVNVIFRIIDEYGIKTDAVRLLYLTKKILNKEITTQHHLLIGVIIGYRSATYTKRTTLLQSIQLCQRQN